MVIVKSLIILYKFLYELNICLNTLIGMRIWYHTNLLLMQQINYISQHSTYYLLNTCYIKYIMCIFLKTKRVNNYKHFNDNNCLSEKYFLQKMN